MRFNNFEQALSPERLQRYLDACNNDTRKAMTLYRYNLRLSQEMFTILSCFEITLRNAIDRRLRSQNVTANIYEKSASAYGSRRVK